MKMNRVQKKELILKNFDILKDNYPSNKDSIHSAIKKMFEVDCYTALEMWEYALIKHEAYVKESGDYITAFVVDSCNHLFGERKTCNIIVQNTTLKTFLFSLSRAVFAQVDIIAALIQENDLQLADELLQLIYLNRFRSFTWYEVMERTLFHLHQNADNISSSAFELLDAWCNKISNPEEHAKLSLKMMEFVE